jgi:hypothetical protein
MTNLTNTVEQITKGMIVEYVENGRPGNYRVTCVKGGKVNLGSIFGKHIYHKGIPVELVKDDQGAWYKRWQQSESYRCM